MNITQEQNNFADAYFSHDINILQDQLKNVTTRIKFGEWLLDAFSPETASGFTEFNWHSKVISLLCVKARENSKLPAADNKKEDMMIANLITKADPLPAKTFKFIRQLARLISHSTGMILNSEQIFSVIKEADLPSTRTVLLRRILEHQDLDTIITIAILQNNVLLIRAISEQYLTGFKSSLTRQNKNGSTPVTIAAKNNVTEILKVMAKTAPIEFEAALVLQNQKGNTAVTFASSEILTLMATVAPTNFRAALTMKNKEGHSPVELATMNVEKLKVMIKNAPEVLDYNNRLGDSLLDIMKMNRPPNYKEITKLYKDSELKKLNKELVRRKALCHEWDLAGITSLILKDTETVLKTFKLEGHFSPQWFHMLGKDLEPFTQTYPDLLTKSEKILFKEVLDMGANPNAYSLEAKLERIKKGLPTIITAGYVGHAVTILIWGDRFVICNRGGETRRPLEIYHFNPGLLDIFDLVEILKTSFSGTNADYKELFFDKLTKKLLFTQNEVDRELENVGATLPNQTVGNCSFVSPITAIYAFVLLVGLRNALQIPYFGTKANQWTNEKIESYDEEFFSTSFSDEESTELESIENLTEEKNSTIEFIPKEDLSTELISDCEFFSLEEDTDAEDFINSADIIKIKKESELRYQTWLSFEKITILESNIKSLDNLHYQPDFHIISESLKKAHLLDLDDLCKKKLESLTNQFQKFYPSFKAAS